MRKSKAQTGTDEFQQRLKRINKGGANTMGEIHLGPRDEVRANAKKRSRPTNTVRLKKKTKKIKNVGEAGGSSLVIFALFLGGFSMFVGQAAAYHLFGGTGLLQLGAPVAALEPFMQYAPIALGGLLALAFAWTFRLTTFMRMVAIAGGATAMVVYHVNIVTTLPGLYASFFNKEYVEAIFAAV